MITTTACKEIIGKILCAETPRELARLRDEIVPCALITNLEQDVCRQLIKLKFVKIIKPVCNDLCEYDVQPQIYSNN